MQDLRVVGVESGALVVVSDEGGRYRIAIDEVLQSKLRQSIPVSGVGRKLSPREIQAHIRSGMSAQDVSAITGVPVEYIEKFEGPVLAEREYVVESALAVTVHTAVEPDPMAQGANFGTVIRERLHSLGAINERWASWKEEGAGWVVKLSFAAEQIEHDARWRFEPKKRTLAPLNSEAITLSQQGEAAGALIPRLRAVSERDNDRSRFDSGAFELDEIGINGTGSVDVNTPARSVASSNDAEVQNDTHQTADLLDALRRRRGEREAAQFSDDEQKESPATNGIRHIDIPLGDFLDETPDDGRATAPQPTIPAKSGRKGRAAMPSWDDIVFGARPDDDLA